ncbi:MFS general substrate transporter [Ascobolus immersus RN42]|uniref:MFS general substrate transporter n=1 Tax=Ascobolus immersus RN42 TaxID=1160509 RepID=A0A3N4HS29_ASCIM|nr:MFS general substrate transporter [Ascobolus immersus RN42]
MSTSNSSANLPVPDTKTGYESGGYSSDSGLPVADEKAIPQPEEEVRSITGLKWFIVMAALLSTAFLYAVDNTIVAVVIPNLTRDLGHVEKIPWLSVSFTLAGTICILPLSKLYTIFNTKWLYIFFLFLFLVGSALCGAANTMDAEIIGRALAGLGGNGLYVGLVSFISILTTGKERPIYLSFIGLVWGAGVVLGPIIGAGFHDLARHDGWRWGFYLNLFVGGACLPIFWWFLPSNNPRPNNNTPLSQIVLKEMDFLGTATSMGAFLTGIIALSFGGVDYAWDDGRIIACWTLCGLFIIAFALVEYFNVLTTPDNRIFPLHFLGQRGPLLVFLIMIVGGCGTFTTVYYVPLLFQFTRGDSATDAAVRLLPFIILLVAFTVMEGFYLSKIGYYTPTYIVGTALVLGGSIGMTQIDMNTSVAQIYGFEVLLGVGVGIFGQAGIAVVQGMVAPHEVGRAIGYMLVAQLGGLTIGLSTAGAIFVNNAKSGILRAIPGLPEEEVVRAISGASSELLKNVSEEELAKVLEAIVAAMAKTYWVPVAGGAGALLLSFALKWERLQLGQVAPGH